MSALVAAVGWRWPRSWRESPVAARGAPSGGVESCPERSSGVISDEVIKRDTLLAFEKALDDAVLVELDGAAPADPFERYDPSALADPLEPEPQALSAAERRATPRYSLIEPAVVQVASW